MLSYNASECGGDIMKWNEMYFVGNETVWLKDLLQLGIKSYLEKNPDVALTAEILTDDLADDRELYHSYILPMKDWTHEQYDRLRDEVETSIENAEGGFSPEVRITEFDIGHQLEKCLLVVVEFSEGTDYDSVDISNFVQKAMKAVVV